MRLCLSWTLPSRLTKDSSLSLRTCLCIYWRKQKTFPAVLTAPVTVWPITTQEAELLDSSSNIVTNQSTGGGSYLTEGYLNANEHLQTTDPTTEAEQVANRHQIREILKDSLLWKVDKWFKVEWVPLLKVNHMLYIFQVVAYHNRPIYPES